MISPKQTSGIRHRHYRSQGPAQESDRKTISLKEIPRVRKKPSERHETGTGSCGDSERRSERKRARARVRERARVRKGLPSLFVVPGGVSSQLEHLGRQILHHGGEVDRCTGADTLRVVAFPEETVDPPHGKLQPGPAAAGLRLPLRLTWKREHAT